MDTGHLRTRQNGVAIRALRQKDGQKVPDLAAVTGMTPQAIRNIENGHRQASVEACNAIARALSVPVNAILRDPIGAEEEDPDEVSAA